MAYLPDWIAKHIVIPRADLIPLGGSRYRLDMSDFHKEMRRLEWDFGEGLWAPNVVEYVAPITVGGTDLAPVVTVINDYTFEFEEFVDAYSVELNGANSNLADVTIVNNVSVRPKNSAGLIIVNGEAVECVQELEVALSDPALHALLSESNHHVRVDNMSHKVEPEPPLRVVLEDGTNLVRVDC